MLYHIDLAGYLGFRVGYPLGGGRVMRVSCSFATYRTGARARAGPRACSLCPVARCFLLAKPGQAARRRLRELSSRKCCRAACPGLRQRAPAYKDRKEGSTLPTRLDAELLKNIRESVEVVKTDAAADELLASSILRGHVPGNDGPEAHFPNYRLTARDALHASRRSVRLMVLVGVGFGTVADWQFRVQMGGQACVQARVQTCMRSCMRPCMRERMHACMRA